MFKAPSDELFTRFWTLSSILCTHSVPSPSRCSQMVGIMRLYQINNPDWQQEGNMITFFLWHRPQLNTGADDRPPKEERWTWGMSTALSSSVSPAWKSWLKLARSQAKETNCKPNVCSERHLVCSESREAMKARRTAVEWGHLSDVRLDLSAQRCARFKDVN